MKWPETVYAFLKTASRFITRKLPQTIPHRAKPPNTELIP